VRALNALGVTAVREESVGDILSHVCMTDNEGKRILRRMSVAVSTAE